MKRIAAAIAIIATMLAAPSAIAGTLTEFNAAVESVAVHYRAALNFLRTGDSTLKRDDISPNRHPALVLYLSMIFPKTGIHFSGSCFSRR